MTGLLSFRKKIRSGYVLSFLLLLLSYFLIFYVQQRLARQAKWVIHSYTVINNAELLRTGLTDAETALRGYVLTQDARFLKPYHEAIKQIPVLHAELRALTVDNKEQERRLDTLELLVKKKMDILAKGLDNFEASGLRVTDEMKTRREASLNAMDSMRIYIAKIIGEEQQLIHVRRTKTTSLFNGTKVMAVISLAIVFIALFFSFLTFNRENKAREMADKRAFKYRIDLESNKNELKEKDIELKELKDMEKFTSTGRIARTIAHEVRNPLTNILLATDQLREMENKSEESPVLLELINRNATRINHLVSDLLNATRFSHLDFGKSDVNQLVDEAVEMSRDRIDLNHITVEKSYTTEVFEIYVDKEKMKVALLNIIVNAIEAMEKGKGILQLKTKKQGNRCIIEIRDNGKGMDEEALQKLFEPYFTSKLKGNGLGLTNTQNIILNHSGKINVYSKPEKGSMFVIALDLSPKEEGKTMSDV